NRCATGRLLTRRPLQASEQLGAMPIENAHELVVVDVAKTATEMNFTQKSKMGEQLPQPDIGGKLPYLREDGQRFPLLIRRHGNKSPILGSPANAFSNLPITSTRINLPGASLAMRVARVTPLYSISTPSEPSYTHGGGIPSFDAAKSEI